MRSTPNLFVIGATKCATTTLHTLLDCHPKIEMSRLKEPGFFLEKHERHPEIQAKNRDESTEVQNYLALFPGEPHVKYMGESSTGYSHLPHRAGVPDRIRAFCTDPKFIYVMRDPVNRTISHYFWNVQHEGERRPILDALREDSVYRDVSNYAMQLRPYFEMFGKDHVYAMTFESLIGNSREALGALFKWLDIEHAIAEEITLRNYNKTPDEITSSRIKGIERFRHSNFWNLAGPLFPSRFRRWVRTLTEISIDRSAEDLSKVSDFLRPFQLEQTAELSDLLNRSFPEWDELYVAE